MRINEKVIENELKNDGRDYELPLAPITRLLLEGSKQDSGAKHKVSGAAKLEFRKQIEDYALQLAASIGNCTRHDVRNTIKQRDVIKAVTPQTAAAREL